jgi:hypothetical protein
MTATYRHGSDMPVLVAAIATVPAIVKPSASPTVTTTIQRASDARPRLVDAW